MTEDPDTYLLGKCLMCRRCGIPVDYCRFFPKIHGEAKFTTQPDSPTLTDPKEKKIKIDVKGKAGKKKTKISGLESTEVHINTLIQTVKKEFGVGANIKDKILVIQGDLGIKVGKLLEEMGVPAEKMNISGAHSIESQEAMAKQEHIHIRRRIYDSKHMKKLPNWEPELTIRKYQNVLKIRSTDTDPLDCRNTYKTFSEYQQTMRACILQEWKYAKEEKKKLKMECVQDIHFSEGSEAWFTTFPAPARFLNSVADVDTQTVSMSRVNMGDTVIITWVWPDDSFPEIDKSFCRMKGQVKQINERFITAVFYLDKSQRPPNSEEVGSETENIPLDIQFKQSPTIWEREAMAVEALQFATEKISSVILGIAKPTKTVLESPLLQVSFDRFHATESQKIAVNAAIPCTLR